MSILKRTFKVIEIGQKDSSVSNLEFNDSELVDIVDLTTRSHGQIKAREVSIYRHLLQIGGKLFNILDLFPRCTAKFTQLRSLQNFPPK